MINERITIELMLLNSKVRHIWAEKTFELTNIGAGALIFGQFISERGFSWNLLLLGLLFAVSGYFVSWIILTGKR